jgi:hypothetical protein
MHSSGNPMPWDIEGGAAHKEYLSMLHVKKGDYAHWAVRIDKASRRITHISAGPVLKARDYRNEVSTSLLTCWCARQAIMLFTRLSTTLVSCGRASCKQRWW